MEELLQGGNTTPGVVRVGDTVRRPRDGRSDDAARALIRLEELRFPYAPRYLGIDSDGRDTLTWIEGATTSHPLERDEGAYRRMGEILGILHQMTSGDSMVGADRVLLHGDPGPFNVVCRAGMPVALIDWDTAHAGDPMDDVGYAAWAWCLLADPRVPIADQARRIRELRDGYCPDMAGSTVLDAIERAQDRLTRIESRNADDESMSDARRAHARRAVAWAAGDRALLHHHRTAFASAFV